jgi:probable 2-oxoglutarate dehydrogenase E1 component DHKTD1
VALAQGTLDTPNKVVTAVQDEDLLRHIGRVSVQSTSIPNNKGTVGVTIHDRLARTFVDARLAKMSATESSDTDRDRHIDWATAEALAFGSLLVEGHNVRLCGQDAGRGTFSHRHARLVDQLDQTTFATPLNHIRPPGQQGLFTVLNSPLSELAVLGFEYGYSVEDPNTLCVWEAQFGDFFNGAQIMIDAFISSGEDKWLRQSGLVMLLPHGYDGAGAEHSSARLERFLQLCDTDSTLASARTNTIPNMHVIFPTTAANYFHALRRQLKRNYLKPLVVMAPKTLLRAPEANSPLSHFSDPTKAFSPILPDPDVLPNDVDAIRTVFLCSGKFFYDLQRERNVRQRKDIAIIRLEELSPFPHELLRAELKRFSQATKYVWVQEEPQNMGAWSYVDPRLRNLVGIPPRLLSCASPAPLSASAVGSSFLHSTVTKQLIQKCFG